MLGGWHCGTPVNLLLMPGSHVGVFICLLAFLLWILFAVDALGRKMRTQVLGSLPLMCETRMAPGFRVPQSLLLWGLDSEPVDQRYSLIPNQSLWLSNKTFFKWHVFLGPNHGIVD